MVTAANSTGNATIDKINNSRNSLANNEQTFLKLLTTQLKNYDPPSPTDTTQMTSQITQMTGVEQQLVTNDLLAALVGMSTGGGISEGVNLMGKQVTAETDKSVLKNKEATWSYTQSRAATGVKIEVLDKFDKVIATILPDDMSGGDHTFKWDGKSADGTQQPEGGEYTIKVTATDAEGSKITTTSSGTHRRCRHQGHQRSGVNMVWIGDTKVPLDSVIGVTNAPAATRPGTKTRTKRPPSGRQRDERASDRRRRGLPIQSWMPRPKRKPRGTLNPFRFELHRGMPVMSINSAMLAGVSGLISNSSALAAISDQHRQRQHRRLQAQLGQLLDAGHLAEQERHLQRRRC